MSLLVVNPWVAMRLFFKILLLFTPVMVPFFILKARVLFRILRRICRDLLDDMIMLQLNRPE